MGGGPGCCFLRILSRSWLVRCRMLPGGKRGRAEGNRRDFRGRGGGKILSATGEAANLDPCTSGIVVVLICRAQQIISRGLKIIALARAVPFVSISFAE